MTLRVPKINWVIDRFSKGHQNLELSQGNIPPSIFWGVSDLDDTNFGVSDLRIINPASPASGQERLITWSKNGAILKWTPKRPIPFFWLCTAFSGSKEKTCVFLGVQVELAMLK